MALPLGAGMGAYMRPPSSAKAEGPPPPGGNSDGGRVAEQEQAQEEMDEATLRMIVEGDGFPAEAVAEEEAPPPPASEAAPPDGDDGEKGEGHRGGLSSAAGVGDGGDEEGSEAGRRAREPSTGGMSASSSFLSEAAASQLSAPPPRRAAAAAAASALANSSGPGAASGGATKTSSSSGGGGVAAFFTITDARAAASAPSASLSSKSTRGGGSKAAKRSLVHRAGGLLDRTAFVGTSTSSGGGGSGAGAPVFLQGSAAVVDGGVEAYWQYHLHVQQILAAGRPAPHRRAPPPPGPPHPGEWARLAFSGASNALSGGQVLVEEPWVSLGPSAAGPPPGRAVLDWAAAQAAGRGVEDAALARRAEEVQALLKLKEATKGDGSSGGDVDADVDVAALQEEALALASLRLQRELWARLLRWQGARPAAGVGVSEHGYAALPEAVLVKQRVKRQTRGDIKRFEREQRRRQQDKEEARRRRLRGYLQGVMAHREEFLRFHRQRRGEQRTCAQAVRRWFDTRDKRVEREKDHEERARLQALKDNDMDEYIRLVEKTRNERLNYLIQQTDAYIAKIADLVQSERAKADGEGGAALAGAEAEVGLGGEAADAGMSAKARSYYAVTHRRTEEVSQPALLKGGALKEYQLAGLQWMVSLYNNQLSGILADEMVRACLPACLPPFVWY
jgi:hypothetical protein